LDRRLGGPQDLSGRGGERKNFQSLAGLEVPIIQTVAQRCTAELSLAQKKRRGRRKEENDKKEGKEENKEGRLETS
jgi:hypothetical protein